MDDARQDPALQAHLTRLDALGWFAQYPAGDPRAACIELFEDGIPAHWCLPSAIVDLECVYAPGDHRQVLLEVVSSACGLLGCERIVETWGGDEQDWANEAEVTVEIHLASGQVLSRSWVQEGDHLSAEFGDLLLDFVEAQGLVLEEVESGQWVVGRQSLVDEVFRVGRRLDQRQPVAEAPPRQAAVEPSAPDPSLLVPSTATAEELTAWWLFRAGFYLTGHPMKTWKMLHGDDHGDFRDTYVATMNAAFDELSPMEQRALVAREIAEIAEKLRPSQVAAAMELEIEEVYALVGAAQAKLREVGERLWAEAAL